MCRAGRTQRSIKLFLCDFLVTCPRGVSVFDTLRRPAMNNIRKMCVRATLLLVRLLTYSSAHRKLEPLRWPSWSWFAFLTFALAYILPLQAQ